MKEKIIYHKDMIIITIDEEKPTDEHFFMKIGDKWSINKGEDLQKVITALELNDWSLLKNVYSKNAILHDLYDAELATKEEWKGDKMNFEEKVEKVRKDMYDVVNSVTEYEGDGQYIIFYRALIGACKHFAYQKCSQTEEYDKIEEEYEQMLQACEEYIHQDNTIEVL